MREPIELRAALFPVTQHQIAGQVAVLKEARARITAGDSKPLSVAISKWASSASE